MNNLQEKHSELTHLFEEHATQTRTLQEQAGQEIVPDVETQQEMSTEDSEWVEDYLQDLGTWSKVRHGVMFELLIAT